MVHHVVQVVAFLEGVRLLPFALQSHRNPPRFMVPAMHHLGPKVLELHRIQMALREGALVWTPKKISGRLQPIKTVVA